MNKRIPILYYHEVVPAGEGYSYQKIETENFQAQMAFLQEQGYETLLFSQLGDPLPEKPVIISFDDGFRTVYENAAPIMEKYGIRGNVYLPTAYVDKDPKFMTWQQIAELQKTGTWQMQAHTHSHVDIRTLTDKTMLQQLEASNRAMQTQLGYRPEVFCMPFGTYDRRSVRLLSKLGTYRYLLGSYYGFAPVNAPRQQVLPRIGISNDDTLEVFAKKLSGSLNWKGPLQRLRLTLQNLRKGRITHYEY